MIFLNNNWMNDGAHLEKSFAKLFQNVIYQDGINERVLHDFFLDSKPSYKILFGEVNTNSLCSVNWFNFWFDSCSTHLNNQIYPTLSACLKAGRLLKRQSKEQNVNVFIFYIQTHTSLQVHNFSDARIFQGTCNRVPLLKLIWILVNVYYNLYNL